MVNTEQETLFNINISTLEQSFLENHKTRYQKKNPNYTLEGKTFKTETKRKNLPSYLLCNVEAQLLNALIQDLIDQNVTIASIEKDGLVVLSNQPINLEKLNRVNSTCSELIGRKMPFDIQEWSD